MATKKRSTKTKKRQRRCNPASLSPSDRRDLARAMKMAKQFHGPDGDRQVVELSAKERKVSRFAVIAGALEDFTYAPAQGSQRGNWKWNHESGDRGNGKPRSPNKPFVVVDPKSKRPVLVAHKSPMRFSSKRGFVG